jgi:arylsulfatase A-like enzyme
MKYITNRICRRRFIALAILLLAPLPSLHAVTPSKPNVLIILADDMGFSDLACYGGEIATPNLDALARDGLRFTQFYNTARCWPSRAALLTGYYAQAVRRDTVPGVTSGVAGTRPAWAPLLPDMLKPLGYRSYHSGKWHLDGKPLDNGFEHSYSLDDHDRYFTPRSHVEDGKSLPPVAPDTGYYATTAIADHAIKCLKEHAENHSDQPFFEFLAFTSPHFPLQAPAEDIARYRNRYLRGWDALRAERWQRMHAMNIGGSALSAVERGLGPPWAYPEAIKKLGPNEVNRPLPWEELTETQRDFQAKKMAVHAAMVDRMDREIGRVLAQLRAMKAMDNTLILFLSDNGASAEMMVRGDGHDPAAECGTGATFLSLGPGWSTMANTPFRRHKSWVHEGGISTSLIAHWPRGIVARGELRHTPGHLIDILPTILEVAGGTRMETWRGQPVPPAPGKSLVPPFAKDGAVAHESFWWLHVDNRALRAGDWKIVAAGKESPWELYNLATDRAESKNLAAEKPEKVAELAAMWSKQTEEYYALAQRDLPKSVERTPASATPPAAADNQYAAWQHAGSVYLLTTPEGANLDVSASVENFPVLVRLHKDFFNFNQAKPNGDDLRFSTPAGTPLAYQIEQWEPAKRSASIWVRIPTIKGNARQEIRIHWGKADAASESSGKAVFNQSNGYLSVWHMNGEAKDEVGTLDSKDVGTTASTGMVGQSRHFAGGEGIFCGDKIANYPSATSSHTSEAWFRAERPNTTILGWGNEGGGRGSKVRMQLRSPPHIHVDSDFADVNGQSTLPMGEWIHVVHTYNKGDGKIYINGRLDGSAKPMLGIKIPARFWIGGWYHNYDFVGDIDEVRISKVARSPDWVKLEYENQKPLQTAVGPVVQPGSAFSVSPAQLTVNEGQSATVSAQAGGAQKIYWILKSDGRETVVATDRFTFTFDAGRVAGDKLATLQFKAIYSDSVKAIDIPITIKEAIPEPEFVLLAPANWNGRKTIEVVPQVTNLNEMRAKGAGELHYTWSVSDIAVIKETSPGKLILTRAQNSGKLSVTATIHNGGQPTTRTAEILVTEPDRDPSVARKPATDEKPEDNQFYPRDDKNEGTLYYNGTLNEAANAVFLRVYADDRPYKDETQKPDADKGYAFSVKLKPGLIHYKVEFGTKSGGRETLLNTVNNLVCGDAYLINGQSNAEATAWGNEDYPFTSPWIRSYGSTDGSPQEARLKLWGSAVARSNGGKNQVGYWGMELARRLVESQKIPICIINGAVGGTRIDQHQRNRADPEDVTTIYGRLLWRVRQAKLSHGIRGVLWHQGENDQGADGPTGGFGWETYRQYFIDLAAAWKQDYPNIQHYYIFQIWPKSCAMGIDGSDNRLREVQRTLPAAFSNMSIMSTLGIEPPGGCHYPPAGYAEFARLICPLVERDNYGKVFTPSITPPNLIRAFFINDKKEQIVMQFDQPMQWDNALSSQFYLDGESGKVASGAASGNRITLKLMSASRAQKLTYLDSKSWSQKKLLRGENGIAALTFCDVALLSGEASP